MLAYIVRESWDTGWEDLDASDLETARRIARSRAVVLRKNGVKDPEKWIKIYELREVR